MQAMMSKALGSFKQVGFLCFMMWMSGSQIHLFSIMMLVTGIYQPFSTLFSVNQGITLLRYSALSTPQHPAAWLQLMDAWFQSTCSLKHVVPLPTSAS